MMHQCELSDLFSFKGSRRVVMTLGVESNGIFTARMDNVKTMYTLFRAVGLKSEVPFAALH